jgi:DNA-binding HxlR family transcriptional regulator
MKTYGQFCPISQALEILAERWTLLIVRELLTDSHRFTEIQRGVPLISRTLLSQRLKSLQDCNLVTKTDVDGAPYYSLTDAGEALRDVVMQLGVWGKAYAQRRILDEHLDPKLLMWDLQRRLNRDSLPTKRTVVLFHFSDAVAGESRFWLHIDQSNVDICFTPAGFTPDLTVETDVRTLTEVWMGYQDLAACLRAHKVRLLGPPALKRAFPTWLMLSAFAAIPAAPDHAGPDVTISA